MSLGLGVIGCGSVFAGPYRAMIGRLRAAGRVHVSAVYDVDRAKRHGAAAHYDVDRDLRGPEDVIEAADVVLVLTSMNEHGPLAKAALEAGRHVLVEKPMATSLQEAAELLELAEAGPGVLVCAPHTFSARPSEPSTLPSGRARSETSSPPAPATAGRAPGGTSGSTPPAAGRCSTSASTTSRACAPSSAPRGA